MTESQDLLIIAAAVAGGKTVAVAHVMSFFDRQHVPYNPVPIRDGQYFNALNKDHELTGGQNHYHDWCKGETGGHASNAHDVDFTWTITGYSLVQEMWKEFTQTASNAPRDGRITLVEWSGGRGKPPDRSFTRQVEEFESGTYDNSFFSRIKGVLHPVIRYERRVELNNYRLTHQPSPEKIQQGLASWALPPEVMETFRDDDFDVLRRYLEQHGVRNIYDVENDAHIVEGKGIESHFSQHLDEPLALIFPPNVDREGRPNRPSLREGRGG